MPYPDPLLLKDCQLVNVHSNEIYTTDIRIEDGRVVCIDPSQDDRGAEILDCAGLYALPGLIEPHMHVESTGLWPDELARILVPLGTTTVVIDATNPLHTGGPQAVRALIDGFKGLHLRAFISIPSYSPLDSSRETAAYELEYEDLQEMLSWPETVSIGEAVSSKIIAGDSDYLTRIAASLDRGLRASGHGNDLPAENEAALDAYAASGIGDDHGARTPAEVLGRLGRGQSLFVVETPSRHNFSGGILPYIIRNGTPSRGLQFCVDNITAGSIVSGGHGYLDRSLRLAIQAGIPAPEAIRMGTLNPARYYRKEQLLGSISPGRAADILLVEKLDKFPPKMVLVNGTVVARDGEMVVPSPKSAPPENFMNTIKLHPTISRERLAVRAPGPGTSARVRVVALPEGNRAGNVAETAVLPVVNGAVETNPAEDILKICMIERYGRNGNMAVGFTRGFKLRRGAMASSMSLPSNNIVAVGTSDAELWTAIQHVVEIGGGNAVVAEGEILADVRFPIGGIMSTEPFEHVVQALAKADLAAKDGLGCEHDVPFWAMSSTVLHTAPEIGLTDHGFIDVARGQFVQTVMEDSK